jgi:homoserine kinase type II
LVEFAGIEQGIENTNYYLKTTKAKFILTIFEKRVANEDLPFFIALTNHLRSKSINCPVNIKDKSGNDLRDIEGKKAALISFLEGKGVDKIEDLHIARLGEKAARMHNAVGDFHHTRKNDMGMSKWVKLFESIAERADEIQTGLSKRIADEIYFLAANWPFGLPSGIIHADIFPDNVFFKEGEISGVIDFYFACTDYFAYDIAIIFCAWGIETDAKRQKLFFDEYEKVRKLSPQEREAMPVLLRGAALRFLLTRAYDWFNTPANAVVKKKDPMEYVKKLESLL